MPYDQFGRWIQPIPGTDAPNFTYGPPPQQMQPMPQMQPVRQAPGPQSGQTDPTYAHYGQAETGGYGDAGAAPHEGYRQALLAMPSAGQLGGPGPVPFVRYPCYPTSPFYSTNPNVGYQTRFYSCGVLFTDPDYRVGAGLPRPVQFDIPVRIVGFNASAVYYFGNPMTIAALPLGVKPNDTYLLRAEYTTGDKLHISSRLGSTVTGSCENPGEIGGTGYSIDAGASFMIEITPLMPNLRIDVTLVCLEMRGPRNFSR